MNMRLILVFAMLICCIAGASAAPPLYTDYVANTTFTVNATGNVPLYNQTFLIMISNATGTSGPAGYANAALVYTNGQTRKDFFDVNVSNVSGTPYQGFLENVTRGANSANNATVRVILPVVYPDNTTTVTVHFGNSSQTTSTLVGTGFAYVDDFTTQIGYWGSLVNVVFAPGHLTVGSSSGTSAYGYTVNSNTLTPPYTITVRAKPLDYYTSRSFFGITVGQPTKTAAAGYSSNNGYRLSISPGTSSDHLIGAYAEKYNGSLYLLNGTSWSSYIDYAYYYKFVVIVRDDNSTTVRLMSDDYTQTYAETTMFDSTYRDGYFGLLSHGYSSVSGSRGDYDWIVIQNSTSDSVSTSGYYTRTSAFIANFGQAPDPSPIYANVSFTDGTLGDPVAWYWDFGDMTNSTLKNPVHAYSAAGAYTVSLNATNVAGNISNVSKTHTVIDYLPTETFVCNPVGGNPEFQKTCNVTSESNYPTSWNWSFGDGGWSNQSIPSLKNVTHTYSANGIYTVDLYSSNTNGTAQTTRTSYITVIASGNTTGNYTQSWALQNANATWGPRYGMAVAALPNGHIILTGGRKGVGSVGVTYYDLSETWMSADKGKTWNLQSNLSWQNRSWHSMVATANGTLYLMGGQTNTGVASLGLTDVWASTDEGVTWIELTPDYSTGGMNGRSYFAMTTLESGNLLVATGYPSYSTPALDDAWVSLNGATWYSMNAAIGTNGSYQHTMVPVYDGSGGSALMFPGGVDGTMAGTQSNVTWFTNDSGTTWTTVGRLPVTTERIVSTFGNSMNAPACNLQSNGIFYFGGFNTTYVSRDNGITWEDASGPTVNKWWDRNYHGGVCLPSGEAVILGGMKYTPSPYTVGDVWITATNYTHSFLIVDAASNATIPIATLVDATGQTNVTVAGVGYLVEPTGNFSVSFSASGYTPHAEDFYSDGNTSHIVRMAAATDVTPNTNLIYVQRLVRLRAVDMYRTPLVPVTISARYISNTLPSQDPVFLQQAFGISSEVAGAMMNSSLAMSGKTGADGATVFMMFPAIQYNITIENATMGVYCQQNLNPEDNDYVLYCPTNSQKASSQTLAQTLNRSYIWISEPNASYVTIHASFQDRTGLTDSVLFNVTVGDNGTVLYSHNFGNPGVSQVLDNYTMPNIRGLQIKSYLAYNRSG